MSADDLIAHAERCKVKVKDGRLDFPRSFPAYASGNRYVSNVPGSTMFVPVTEVTRQYINGLFYVLAQEPGQRPMFLDDFNLFLPCGCEKWVMSKFLNKDIPIPLGIYAKGRTEYESLLLLAEPGARGAGHGARRVDSCGVCADDPARRLSRYRPRPGISFREAERHHAAASVPGCGRQPSRARRPAAVVCAAVLQGYRRGDRRDPGGESTGRTGCTTPARPPRPA